MDAGGGGVDAGPRPDTGTPPVDAGPGPADTGTPPADTGTPPVDSGPPPACRPDERGCEGETFFFCDEGERVEIDCFDEGAYCTAEGCAPWRCEPGERFCMEGAVAQCDVRGSGFTLTACPEGSFCDPDSASCVDDVLNPDCEAPEALGGFFAERIDLCDEDDDWTYVPMGDCGAGSVADGGDAVFTFDVMTRQRVVLDLRDDDGSAAVDTVMYLLDECGDPMSQLACDDDVPCSESDVRCSDSDRGVQVRQSIIDVVLDPGTYYVVVDSFLYTRSDGSFTCGQVRLDIDRSRP